MNTRPTTSSGSPGNPARSLKSAIHSAVLKGLIIDRRVKIGTVRGVVIGYNIARRGAFPGSRFPLLVKTELGTAKFSVDEVAVV